MVITAIDAILGAGQDHILLFGMDCERADLWLRRQPGGDRFPGTLARQASVQASTYLASRNGFSGQANVHVGL
jgi:hypothetical protein